MCVASQVITYDSSFIHRATDHIPVAIWMIYIVYTMSCATCLMPYSLCLKNYALFLMPYALYVLCLMNYAVWPTHASCTLTYRAEVHSQINISFLNVNIFVVILTWTQSKIKCVLRMSYASKSISQIEKLQYVQSHLAIALNHSGLLCPSQFTFLYICIIGRLHFLQLLRTL